MRTVSLAELSGRGKMISKDGEDINEQYEGEFENRQHYEKGKILLIGKER